MRLGALASALALALMPAPATAQLSGSLAVESDYRLRGYSLSEGRPAATLQLGYDHPSGLYLNGSASLTWPDGEPRLLGTQLNLGYSKRLGPDVVIDAGLLRADYRPGYDSGLRRNYSEAYLGATVNRVSARIFYSPDYLRDDVSTLYGEIETFLEPAPDWRLSGHLGGTAYLGRARPYPGTRSAQYDWRLSLSRELGSVEIHGSLSGGGPGDDYYRNRFHGRTRLSVGGSWAF
jgi:uncharacterized protein (TIGR02001 family)